MIFKFLLRSKILQLYYCVSRFHYQVDSWLLLWGRDDGLCTLPMSSVSQLVPLKNKRWLKCGKVCIAVSICVNKGMERTHTHTYTYIEYSWRYKPETNAGCFWARGLRDQDSEVGEGKLFFSVSCPLYVYPALPLLFLRQPHWPCYSSNLQRTLLIQGPCPCHSSAWNTLPPHSFNIHSLPSSWTTLKCHLSTGAPLTTLYVKTPPPHLSLVPPGVLNICLLPGAQ